MALSWNEIKDRAFKFSREWEGTHNEEADAKPFLEAFFNVFGITRRKVSTFEHRVKKLDEHDGYIDLFWKGMLLVEMKSKGKDLDKAFKQAREYMQTLTQHELPKCILVCDFDIFRVYNLEDDSTCEFRLKDLRANVKTFGFMIGYQQKVYKPEDPVNIRAAELMGHLHDELKAVGYTGHHLELYLVRLLFCLFADDTSIFEPDAFQDYILRKTKEDGSDIGIHIAQLFQVLNTPYEQRMATLDEDLATLPYVNGKLFEEILPFASWNSRMRQSLLAASALNWAAISPAIFGSMFQSVMDEKTRRNLGAHYTSEHNILKLIKPLFLDELWREFNIAKKTKPKLEAFHRKIADLRFLDPACGCGNFLVISYRELRLLEIEVIKELLFTFEGLRKEVAAEAEIKAKLLIKCSIDMFYGIEYEEFPAQIAQVAMWLVDHQMNMLVTDTFGQYVSMLPLQHSATIIHANALRINWHTFESVAPTMRVYADRVDVVQIVSELDPYHLEIHSPNITYHRPRASRPESDPPYNYILGNPPFVGHHYQTIEQKKDMDNVFIGISGIGVLDYVCCWYMKAAMYLQKYNTAIIPVNCAFVSTSSISQGEQIGILWNLLLKVYDIKIHFAHRTFKWGNEARGNAAVHVVIIGFSNTTIDEKRLFEYDNVKGEPHELTAKNINPYLVDGPDIVITNRTEPINNVPKMIWGNKPTDGGNFIFDDETEKIEFINREPNAEKWIRKYMSGDDFIQSKFRYCLWLDGIEPSELNRLPEVKKRIAAVKKSRLESKAQLTRKKADTPSLFVQISQPNTDYLAIPEVSSEKRKYIPIAFVDKSVIASNKIQMIPNATLWHFGILTSLMHNIWMRYTCGRLESRFSYSNTIVYNNFPWPPAPSAKQIKDIETAAQQVLDARATFEGSSLADLYDPLTMPPALVKAHDDLDRAVDLAYRPQPFISEAKRMEFLFELYELYTKDLFTIEKVKRKKSVKSL